MYYACRTDVHMEGQLSRGDDCLDADAGALDGGDSGDHPLLAAGRLAGRAAFAAAVLLAACVVECAPPLRADCRLAAVVVEVLLLLLLLLLLLPPS